MNVNIYYFSGTGNTEVVARLLADACQAQNAPATLTRIEDALKDKLPLRDGDLLGIAHPVYGFDAPSIVDRFVDALPPGAGQRVFILKTAGAPSPSNNAASQTIIRRLERKGYNVFYNRLIAMPSNWAISYSKAVNAQTYRAARRKVQHMCAEILNGQTRQIKTNPLAHAAVRLIHNSEEFGGRLFGRMLYTTEACVRCGKCVDNCPTGNIYRRDDKIKFGWRCMWCMRCIYACPRQAIVPRMSKFCVLKSGYDIDRLIKDIEALPEDDAGAPNREFRDYFENIDA